MALNVTTAVFGPGCNTATASPSLVQWDVGQKLRILGVDLPDSYKVEFTTAYTRSAIPEIGDADGVDIPDDLLERSAPITAYVVLSEGTDDRGTEFWVTIHITPRKPPETVTPSAEKMDVIDKSIAALNEGVERAEDAAGSADAAAKKIEAMGDAIAEATAGTRVISLDETGLESARVIETVGVPVYVDDVTQYASYGITEQGWYVFARISAPTGVTVGAGASVTGAAGFIVAEGEDHVDVAVKFEVAAMSAEVTVDWGAEAERFVFKSTDLAIRNLDYRVTFYVYDIAPFCVWEYALTADAQFTAGKYYYTKDENDVYTLAEVTVGEDVPADTYYVHSKLTIEGMTRNVTYNCEVPIDCPVQINLPEIEDEIHGAWFEIRFQHTGSFSSTLVVPEGVKVATEHTQPETAGMNTVDLHYSTAGEVKIWRFLNTHSSIPA